MALALPKAAAFHLRERLYPRTMLGYLMHPMVGQALFLEHGCEVTHNDFMAEELKKNGLSLSDYGWASIQLDGGIEKVLNKIEDWFAKNLAEQAKTQAATGSLADLRVALTASSLIETRGSRGVGTGGAVDCGSGWHGVGARKLRSAQGREDFAATLGLRSVEPTLAYAQPFKQAGFHIMQTPTKHWVETLVNGSLRRREAIVSPVGHHQPMPGNPLVPMVQLSAEETVRSKFTDDLDLILQGDAASWAPSTLELLARVLSHQQTPAANRLGNVDFQVTRGLLSVSL